MAEPPCLSYPLASYPGISRFALDHVTKRPLDLDDLASADDTDSPPAELVRSILEQNRFWGNDCDDLVARWENGARIIVAGQQAGFAGGPGYTIAKLASIIRLAEELSSRGRDTIPIFWVATEDHDFDEVARADLHVRRRLVRLRTTVRPKARVPVGALPIPTDLTEEFLTELSLPRPDWLPAGVSFGDSFARLISSVAARRVLILDSLLPALRKAGENVLARIWRERPSILEHVNQATRKLESLGYPPQVTGHEEDGITLLYEITESGERRKLLGNDRLPSDPARISTAALARPLLQDAVLRPLAFVGGPAELAYYAQLEGVHERLEIPKPEIQLRAHVLFAPDKVLAAAFRHGLTREELLLSPDESLQSRECDRVERLRDEIANLRGRLQSGLEDLSTFVTAADTTMQRPFSRTNRRIGEYLSMLERKGTDAILRNDQERHAAFETLYQTLMPEAAPQDRSLNWISWELGYQGSLLDAALEVALPQQNQFHVCGIGGNHK